MKVVVIKFVHISCGYYRTAGNFGEVFNLANWRVCGKSPNLKLANYCDIALYVCSR